MRDTRVLVLGVCYPDNDLEEFVADQVTVSLLAALGVLIDIGCDVDSINSSQVASSVRYSTPVHDQREVIPGDGRVG